jgi:RHS repeat-associated protein
LLSVLQQTGNTVLDGATYVYDAAGNRTSKTDNRTSVTSTFSYDPLYELTQVLQGSTTTESYSYDAVGNRLSSLGVSPYAYNTSNQLTSYSGVTYTYDNNGNTLTKATAAGTTSYSWDFENRLTSVTLPGSGGTVTFKYDPFGRRIYKSSSSGTSVYAYDKDDLIEETNGSGAVVARYTRTQEIDEPLAMLRSSTTSYYQADSLGSITSLTNAAGSLAQTYTYDSFGKLTASTGPLTNPFQYTGRDFDTETNLSFYRNRYYDPQIGRFLSEDSARFDESVNFYPYVNNNPLTYKDPFGQGIVDCAVEFAKLAALEARLGVRLAEQAAASCKDKGHQKAIDQLQNAIDKQKAKVARHCSDADTKKQLLLLGVIAIAIATAPETGGGSLGWAWGAAAF